MNSKNSAKLGRFLAPLAAIGLVGCGGSSALSGTGGGITVPVVNRVSMNESSSTLVIEGTNFGAGRAGSYVTVDGVDLTKQAIWTDSTITIKGFPASGPGSSGDIAIGAIYYAGPTPVPTAKPVQLSEFRGTVTVISRDLTNYVGFQSTGTYDVHFRACLNGISNRENVGMQTAKDSTCSLNASGVFNGPGYVEIYSRNGTAAVPISYTAPDVTRYFDAALTLNTVTAGAGTLSSPFDPRNITLFFNLMGRDQDGVGVARLTGVTLTNYTKFLTNTGFSAGINGSMDVDYNILAGTWTSADSSTTISWTAMPISHPPK